jgi:hypothetical protein
MVALDAKPAMIHLMREAEMRTVLRQVCGELDLQARARSAASVVCGASLLMVGGCGAPSDLPSPTDAASEDGVGAADASRSDAGRIQPLYMAPAPDAGLTLDSGPVPPYMVQPIDASPEDDDGPTIVYGVW